MFTCLMSCKCVDGIICGLKDHLCVSREVVWEVFLCLT